MICLTRAEWERIRIRLQSEYPPSVILIRSAMRRELGFTPREHLDWADGWPRRVMFLDFFDERMETWFRVKYAELIPRRDNNF